MRAPTVTRLSAQALDRLRTKRLIWTSLAENDPGPQSWVNCTKRELLAIIQGQPDSSRAHRSRIVVRLHHAWAQHHQKREDMLLPGAASRYARYSHPLGRCGQGFELRFRQAHRRHPPGFIRGGCGGSGLREFRGCPNAGQRHLWIARRLPTAGQKNRILYQMQFVCHGSPLAARA